MWPKLQIVLYLLIAIYCSAQTPEKQDPTSEREAKDEETLSDVDENNRDDQDETLGWIDLKYFEEFIVPHNGTQVLDDNTWLLYLFNPTCPSRKCQRLNKAYEQIFSDWEDFRMMRNREDMKQITAQNKYITEARNKFRVGRIDCTQEKYAVCERIDLGSKPPRYVVLNKNHTYFFKGNLAFEYIEKMIISQKYIQTAEKAVKEQDLQGISLKNFNVKHMGKIRRKQTDEGFWSNAEYAMSQHFSTAKLGIELLAKTYGIRRIVINDENIFPVSLCIMSIPMFVFIIAITYDGFNMRAKSQSIEDKKVDDKKQVKNKQKSAKAKKND